MNDGREDDYDLNFYIQPDLIEDPRIPSVTHDAAIMRAPVPRSQTTTRRLPSPNVARQSISSPSTDGEYQVFTPATDTNFQDDQGAEIELGPPLGRYHIQQSVSPPVPWMPPQDAIPSYDPYTETLLYDDEMTAMLSTAQFPIAYQQGQMQMPDRTVHHMLATQPMVLMPADNYYLASEDYTYLAPGTLPHHAQELSFQPTAMPCTTPVPQQRQMQTSTQGYSASMPTRTQRPTRPQRILPAGQPVESRVPSGSSRKGIRKEKLSSEQRAITAQMRKVGACWRCVLQRDPCVSCQNGRCDRCARALAGRPDSGLPCDRTKLPMLIGDFLPASMQLIHQKQSIQDDVKKEVRSWQSQLTLISLSPGFGPDFHWAVYEFVPSSPQCLVQFQYFTNNESRQMERHEKYSPPFGVTSLGQEEKQFECYLETLLNPTLPHLHSYARQAYVSESEYEAFPEQLLTLLVQLYIDTRDQTLQGLLRKVLRLMILTFIMGHTLTIPQDDLPSILSKLERTKPPQGKESQEHTSPRLANRQLKFYFSILRNEVYTELLKHGQNTLRAGKKDQTWLQVFIIMLGLAMVSEEIQGVLHLQALGNVAKRQMDENAARHQANNACGRIDDGFKLLTQLFQHKYRSDKWTSPGSFGNQTPTVHDHASVFFLRRLRGLVDTKLQFLNRVRLSEPAREGHYTYTSRLVARFLVPFTELPEGGSS